MILQIKNFLLFIALFYSGVTAAQNFDSPVSWPIKLSGTFGELRPGHFHMGIDIKSPNGSVGHTIQSIDDGYISRIKIASGGYGKVIYIIHPSGHESVYAHLQKFTPEIDAYVKDQQYAQESYEIDLNIFPDQFIVQKGQKIGEMGMTGRTFGPHLHFELRDKWTGEGLNPLNYGIPVADTEAPRFYQIVIYEMDNQYRVLRKQKIDPDKIPKQINVQSDHIGVGIKTYDRMNGVRNLNGINSLAMKIDGISTFQFDLDTLYHHEQRYINAHKDYQLFQTDDAYVNRMFKLPGNVMDIYQTDDQQGVIQLTSDTSKKVEIQVSDSFDNKRSLAFTISKSNVALAPDSDIFNHEIKHDESSTFRLGELSLSFPKGCVYQTVAARITARYDDALGQKVCRIHDRNEPVHLPYRIALHLPEVPDSLRSKYYISGIDSRGDQTNFGGRWRGDTLTTMLRGFGEYTVGIDNLAPTISTKSFKPNLKGDKSISFEIKDQTPRARLKYKALLDGKWCLMEYDAKRDRLIHRFDWDRHQNSADSSHIIWIQVSDRNGNVAQQEFQFNWQP